MVALLGRLRAGPAVPATAFWPRPKVSGRIVRIDFDAAAAADLANVEVLRDVLRMAFTHRRKQIGSVARRAREPYTAGQLTRALADAEVDRTARPETVPPGKFLRLANAIAAT
jgi:16S rRNA (adenine1518-N6/adenine1519-N6)-dimethyltransferase